MTMQNLTDPTELTGAPVVGPDGAKLGKVDAVYLDNDTSRPEWAAVKSGLFGSHVSLVPLAEADYDGQRLAVPYGSAQMKTAPHHDPGQQLSPDEEKELFDHYGIPYGGETVTALTGDRSRAANHGRPGFSDTANVQGRDTSHPTTDTAMTRSEERLNVGTERVQTGRARLRKHVVTEMQQIDVPVRREEVRLEREPINDANRGEAMAGADITEDEHEIILTEERPVVTTETVPVERVRLGKEVVTEQQTVSGEVRKENIELDDPTRTRRRQ